VFGRFVGSSVPSLSEPLLRVRPCNSIERHIGLRPKLQTDLAISAIFTVKR